MRETLHFVVVSLLVCMSPSAARVAGGAQAGWNSSAVAEGDHAIEVRATSNAGITRNNTITTYVRNSQPPPQSHVGALITGKYQTKQATSFVSTAEFLQGDAVVFRATITADGKPLAGAIVTLSVSGPESVGLTTAASNSQGVAEVKWATKAPAKRTTGTAIGSYTATVTGVAASGCVWDRATGSGVAAFTISKR